MYVYLLLNATFLCYLLLVLVPCVLVLCELKRTLKKIINIKTICVVLCNNILCIGTICAAEGKEVDALRAQRVNNHLLLFLLLIFFISSYFHCEFYFTTLILYFYKYFN